MFQLPKSFLCPNDYLSQQADLEALAASLQGVMGDHEDEDDDEDEGVEKDRGETQHTEGEVKD